jgi:hypothetical protein
VLVKATGSSGNFIDVYASGVTQSVEDLTGWNNYDPGMIFGGNGLPGSLSTYGSMWNADSRGFGKYGFGKLPWAQDTALGGLFQGLLTVKGTIESDRQFVLCNFTSGCYSAYSALTFTTSGSGVNAVVSVFTTTNGNISGVTINTPGTGYAVNDTLNSVTQLNSYGTGAVLTVSSVNGSGGITGLTITNGGAGGYAIIRTAATGTAPIYTFTGNSGNVAINGQAIQGSSLQVGSGRVFTRHAIITASLTPVSVAANACAAQTLTVSGITAGDHVINRDVQPSFTAGLSLSEILVTGANTVSANFCNVTTGALTPASGTYTFDVEQ